MAARALRLRVVRARAAGSPSASAATTASAGGAGGSSQVCDDLGFCGEPEDPGCVACALFEASCADELAACDGEPNEQCLGLDDCYAHCSQGDTDCQEACDTMYPNGIPLLNILYGCILCVECPISCAADPVDCSG